MKVIDRAMRGQSQAVIEAVENGGAPDLQILLQKVCQDYHSIKKHDGHLDLARYLLFAGATPQKEMACEAARGGYELLIQALIDAGLPADIFVNAALGQPEAIQREIDTTATVVREEDSQGMTPLHYCCASALWRNNRGGGDSILETCSKLLSAGASVHATGTYHGLAGVTPLFYVACTGRHPGIARKLLEHGAEISPDMFFAAVGHFQRHGDGNYDVAKVLLERGFEINHCAERTALHAFASHEDLRGVSWLLEHGAEVDAQDAAGDTPFDGGRSAQRGVKRPAPTNRGRRLMVQREPPRPNRAGSSGVTWQGERRCLFEVHRSLIGAELASALRSYGECAYCFGA